MGRLDWDTVARLNRWLELLGRIATVVWVGLIATIVLGVDVKDWVEEVINSGEPLQDVVIVALILPTLAFFLLHSTIGFLRWRLQRELWRQTSSGSNRRTANEQGRARQRRHLSSASCSAASCSFESELWITWPPYLEISGTTLSRVASRTSTNTAALPGSGAGFLT